MDKSKNIAAHVSYYWLQSTGFFLRSQWLLRLEFSHWDTAAVWVETSCSSKTPVQYLHTNLHSITPEKTAVLIITAVEASKLMTVTLSRNFLPYESERFITVLKRSTIWHYLEPVNQIYNLCLIPLSSYLCLSVISDPFPWGFSQKFCTHFFYPHLSLSPWFDHPNNVI